MGSHSTDLKEASVATEAGWRPIPLAATSGATGTVDQPGRPAPGRAVPPTPLQRPRHRPRRLCLPLRLHWPLLRRLLRHRRRPSSRGGRGRGPAFAPDPAPASPSTPDTAVLPVRAWRAVVGFFASFANEPESYHSDRTVDIDFDPPRGECARRQSGQLRPRRHRGACRRRRRGRLVPALALGHHRRDPVLRARDSRRTTAGRSPLPRSRSSAQRCSPSGFGRCAGWPWAWRSCSPD